MNRLVSRLRCMYRRILTYFLASFGGALIVIGVALLPVKTVINEHGHSQIVFTLLQKLERECDSDSPDNDYDWSITAQRTERTRADLLQQLNAIGPLTLDQVQRQRQDALNGEYSQMLTLAAMTLGDDASLMETAKNMVYSSHPAVRLCAARELRKLKDRRTEEWFYLALKDERSVRNDACSNRQPYRYYPVRVVAELALRDMGISAVIANDEP